jgi:hypothetical protein
VLFCTAAEWAAGQGREGFIARTTHQFHWENEGYASFEQYLGTYRSKDRKKARRERDKVAELSVDVQLVRGTAIDDAQWKAIETFYRDTIARHGGHPYLGHKWFQLARERLGDRILAVLASRNGTPVAASLCLQRGDRLYGRYWGSEPAYGALHFELCYHRPIEACIENGWTRFEAGAQGSHKLKRGLRPHPTYSLHWIRHSGLRAAIADAMLRETEMVERDMALLERMHRSGKSERSLVFDLGEGVGKTSGSDKLAAVGFCQAVSASGTPRLSGLGVSRGYCSRRAPRRIAVPGTAGPGGLRGRGSPGGRRHGARDPAKAKEQRDRVRQGRRDSCPRLAPIARLERRPRRGDVLPAGVWTRRGQGRGSSSVPTRKARARRAFATAASLHANARATWRGKSCAAAGHPVRRGRGRPARSEAGRKLFAEGCEATDEGCARLARAARCEADDSASVDRRVSAARAGRVAERAGR